MFSEVFINFKITSSDGEGRIPLATAVELLVNLNDETTGGYSDNTQPTTSQQRPFGEDTSASSESPPARVQDATNDRVDEKTQSLDNAAPSQKRKKSKKSEKLDNISKYNHFISASFNEQLK